MQDVLKRLKAKKLEIIRKEKNNSAFLGSKKNKNIFINIENQDKRTIYHTKIVNDLCIFGINKKGDNKFFISFRECWDQKEIISFNLFSSIKDDDEFLGIFYGCRKPIQKVEQRYEKNGQVKVFSFSKVYYVEFKFKKGSVYCYVKGIARLLEKDKINTKYYKSLIERLINLEKQVYKFYNKKLPNRSFIEEWMRRNLKNYARRPQKKNKRM